MLTKGDVLAFLGKASGPLGTYKEPKPEAKPSPAAPKKEEPKVRIPNCFSTPSTLHYP